MAENGSLCGQNNVCDLRWRRAVRRILVLPWVTSQSRTWLSYAASARENDSNAVVARRAGAQSVCDVLIARGRTCADRERRRAAATPGMDPFCNIWLFHIADIGGACWIGPAGTRCRNEASAPL